MRNSFAPALLILQQQQLSPHLLISFYIKELRIILYISSPPSKISSDLHRAGINTATVQASSLTSFTLLEPRRRIGKYSK
ncbi:ORF1108 [White spot syndrome virus]|uniref:ORF1108 n=1 Tax=White spot syndrome virus TaxID=342409 RepID=A0A2D3I663_9VIRU|nr:ORF1108 [White spot syndrome virus]